MRRNVAKKKIDPRSGRKSFSMFGGGGLGNYDSRTGMITCPPWTRGAGGLNGYRQAIVINGRIRAIGNEATSVAHGKVTCKGKTMAAKRVYSKLLGKPVGGSKKCVPFCYY